MKSKTKASRILSFFKRLLNKVISGEHGIEPSGKYIGTVSNQLDHANVYYNQVVFVFLIAIVMILYTGL